MSSRGTDHHAGIGALLVALQLALMIVLGVWGVPAFGRGVASAGAWLLAAAGVALGLWALSVNRPGNFNVTPVPRSGGRLVQHGPYRWIRHPMYSAVVLVGAACAWAASIGWAVAAWLVLVAVLVVKARFEERWMALAHPAYAEYRERTRMFVPGLL
jgi:protein-S-isoprenylcysteine O-methyltransferase Ste14